MIRSVTFLLAFMSATWGQSFELGVTGGVPVTQAFESGPKVYATPAYLSATDTAVRRYTIGPNLKIGLTHGLGLELGSLYKRAGYDSAQGYSFTYFYGRAIESSWDLPVLVTYRLPIPWKVRPYVAGGPGFRILTRDSLTAYETNPGSYGPTPVPASAFSFVAVANRSEIGGAVAVGAEFRPGPLRISPELRYTRWRADAPEGFTVHGYQNQVEVLVTFGVRVR
jgi:hypothetical protein